jgi:hypothetical protein
MTDGPSVFSTACWSRRRHDGRRGAKACGPFGAGLPCIFCRAPGDAGRGEAEVGREVARTWCARRDGSMAASIPRSSSAAGEANLPMAPGPAMCRRRDPTFGSVDRMWPGPRCVGARTRRSGRRRCGPEAPSSAQARAWPAARLDLQGPPAAQGAGFRRDRAGDLDHPIAWIGSLERPRGESTVLRPVQVLRRRERFAGGADE